MDEEITNNSLLDKIILKLKKNFKIILIIIFIILISFSTYLFLNLKKNKKNILISENYNFASILLKENKNEEAKEILKNIINLEHKTYSPLALYLIIDKKLEKNPETIILSFDKVLSINSINNEGKNLIKIKKSLFLLNILRSEEAIAILNPITSSDSVWKETAIKIIAEYYQFKNEQIKAKEYYDLLKNN